MKKLIRLIVGCLAAINVFMLTAFAAIPSPEVYTSDYPQQSLHREFYPVGHYL